MTQDERGTMPKRIQRQRTKGWRMPENAVYVGRPSKWGNPYPVWKYGRGKCVAMFADLMRGHEATIRRMLRGKDLACWCGLNQPCHADVLLKIANSED